MRICQAKGGWQTTFFENISHCAIRDRQNSRLRESLSNLACALVRMLEFVPDDLSFVFVSEPVGVGVWGMRLVRKAFDLALA